MLPLACPDMYLPGYFQHTIHNAGFRCILLPPKGVTDRWVEANQTLELVQRSLEEYLETKRAKFSRFYFLSNDEVLEIISQTKDPMPVILIVGASG